MFQKLKEILKRKIRNAVGYPELIENSKRVEQRLNALEQSMNTEPRLPTLEQHLGTLEQSMNGRLNAIEHQLSWLPTWIHEYNRNRQDMLILLNETINFLSREPYRIETKYPVAYESNDHLHPWGTKNDNTRHPRFVLACERHFPALVSDGGNPLRPGGLRYLDLGCAGGGLVWDFLLRGHEALGLEGSDYSLKAQRVEWRLLGQSRLFTADIARPFQLRRPNNQPFTAQIISAWEFLEHIQETDLPQMFENIRRHLEPGGYFLGSIALLDDLVDGISYHPTVKPQEWWREKFAEFGLPWTQKHSFEFGDFCRGVGNGYYDGNFLRNPEIGFHFVAQKTATASHP